MFPSRMRYSSPSSSPSGTAMASLPETPLHGLGLSNCHFLPEIMGDSLTASPYMGWLDGPCSRANQTGHDHRHLSNQHNCLPSGTPAINLTSTHPISRSSVPLQGAWTVAAALPTSMCSLQYQLPTALGSFSPYPYQTPSSLQYQTPSYETMSSSIADAPYSWCGLEAQGYQTPKLSSSYSTPLRPVSPTMSHTISASAPESPTFAANPQCKSGIDDYKGGGLAEDFMQSQHQTQNSRAFSWPPGSSNLEQLQEMDALTDIQRSQRDLPNSKQSYRSSHKVGRGGNGGSHRTHAARARVTCDKCNQTFNRKTDLERHINTVRHTR